jgi:hypothetical protein
MMDDYGNFIKFYVNFEQKFGSKGTFGFCASDDWCDYPFVWQQEV